MEGEAVEVVAEEPKWIIEDPRVILESEAESVLKSLKYLCGQWQGRAHPAMLAVVRSGGEISEREWIIYDFMLKAKDLEHNIMLATDPDYIPFD